MEVKRKRVLSAIACECCRKSKVKCDGKIPCGKCLKSNLLCIFAPGRKKPNQRGESSKASPPKTQQSNQPIIKVNRKEELLMTNFTMNHYIEIHYTHVSFLLKEPLDQVKVLFPLDSLPGKLMMYSVLSLSFRKDGNLDFSENFLRYSTSIAKEIFDDTNSETTFYSGIGLSLLSLAASPTDTKKAKLYAEISKCLLQGVVMDDPKKEFVRLFTIKKNALLSSKTSPNLSLLDYFDPSRSETSNFLKPDLNFLFHISSNRVSEADKETLFSKVDFMLCVKYSVFDTICFVKEVISKYFPSINPFEELSIEKMNIPIGLMPSNISKSLLTLLGCLEVTFKSVLPPEMRIELEFSYFIIYKSNSEMENALWYANSLFQQFIAFHDQYIITPNINIIKPSCFLIAFYLECGLTKEANELIDVLSKMTSCYSLAQFGYDCFVPKNGSNSQALIEQPPLEHHQQQQQHQYLSLTRTDSSFIDPKYVNTVPSNQNFESFESLDENDKSDDQECKYESPQEVYYQSNEYHQPTNSFIRDLQVNDESHVEEWEISSWSL